MLPKYSLRRKLRLWQSGVTDPMTFKLLIVLGMFFLLLPLATALNCTAVPGTYLPDCKYVLNSQLSGQEKEYLVTALKTEKGYYQDFTLISQEEINSPPNFYVETGKTVYFEKEQIQGNIFPSGDYLVNYAGKNYLTKGNFSFPAVYPYNRITIKEEDAYLYQTIHIWNEYLLGLFFSVALFGTANYVLMEIIRKYWGRVF